MAKRKDGRDNLIPVRTEAEAKAKGAKGGKASGETRRRKADVKKTITDILNNSYTTVNKDGSISSVTGIEAIMINLFKMATDPKSRNSVQAIKLVLELYEGKQNRAEQRLLNAQIALVEAKVKSIQSVEEMEVEDLAPLSKLLSMQTIKDTNEIKEVTPIEENDND